MNERWPVALEEPSGLSLRSSGDVSLTPAGDALPKVSLGAPDDTRCHWCGQALTGRQRDWCGKACRQTAWRARKVSLAASSDTRRVAYADPPYPGTARRYYRHETDYCGEVDHAALLSLLEPFDGWALSTSEKALRALLPLCPPVVRIGSWVKPVKVSPRTRGPHNAWEPVLYVPARRCPPGVRDWLSAAPARGGPTRLKGRKPLAFCHWLFGLLGMRAGDQLVDLFPGSGMVTKAWAEMSRACRSDTWGTA